MEKTTPSAKETATQRNLIQPSDAIANAAETDGVAILNPPTHGEAQPPEEVKNSDFKPPFAERVNVFAPPGAGTASPSTDGAATASYSASDVTLKGFARVSELRAILMIDELITPLAVGEEKYGVRVVAVEPPQVTLARADQQWSLSLAPSSKQPANGDPARKGDREK